MTDNALRTLERHYRESGAPDAEAAWLRARLRTGERSPIRCKPWPDGGHPDPEFLIPGGCPSCSGTGYRPLRDAVELAAYLGHGPAREAMGAWVEEFQHRTATKGAFWTERLACRDGGGTRYRMLHPDDLGAWLQGLTHWGHETTVRAALAVAREAHEQRRDARCRERQGVGPDFWARPCRCEWHSAPLEAIRAAEAWLEGPSEANRRRCDAHNYGFSGCVFEALCDTVFYGAHVTQVAQRSNLPPDRTRTVIRDALVPWALGYTRRER